MRPTDHVPFQSGRDAAIYLVEISVLAVLTTSGTALFIGETAQMIGFFLLVLASVFALFVTRRRSTYLLVPSTWLLRDWNLLEREMNVLRLAHVRAALRERGLPENVALVGLAICISVVVIALLMNWTSYF